MSHNYDYDAIKDLLENYHDTLDDAYDCFKHAKEWQGLSITATSGNVQIVYTQFEVKVSYGLGRFTVSTSEAMSLGTINSFAPYIEAIEI